MSTVDPPTEKKVKEVKEYNPEPFSFYLKTEHVTKILTANYVKFGLGFLVCYGITFTLMIRGVSSYSEIGDNMLCGGLQTIEEAEAVFDNAILIITIYHLIEWLRWAILITVCFIGHDLIPIWYLTSVNTLFGVGAHVYGIMTYTGADANCIEVQDYRSGFLFINMISIIFFILTVFPFFVFKCMSHETL